MSQRVRSLVYQMKRCMFCDYNHFASLYPSEYKLNSHVTLPASELEIATMCSLSFVHIILFGS